MYSHECHEGCKNKGEHFFNHYYDDCYQQWPDLSSLGQTRGKALSSAAQTLHLNGAAWQWQFF